MAQRIGWALLIAATLYICYFSNLNVIGFVGPDEPRYAWIARDMAESGDWVTPRLYGRPWFEKPPLLYWSGAIFFKLMPSQPEIAARLPSAICALLATLALAWLAWRTHGEECARWLLLLLPTSVGMIGFSRACATDMPFAGMLTVALVCAAVILGLVPPNDDTPILPRTPWLALILFGFFLGLAVLAKGPAALILTGGAVIFWALFTKRWRAAFRLLHPAAIATSCVTALPWYFLCAWRNPDFFRVFIIEHNFKRYLTPEFQHIKPFWFFFPIVLIGLIPWTMLLVPAVKQAASIRTNSTERAIIAYLCSWFLFPLVFFTVSKSKLPGYILPAIPPLSLLVAISVLPMLSSKKPRWIGLAIGLTMILLGVGIPPVVRRLDFAGEYSFPRTATMAAWFALAGGLVGIVLAILRRLRASLLAVQGAILGIVLVGPTGTLGSILDAKYSTRSVVRKYKILTFDEVVSRRAIEEPFSYSLPRAYQYSLNFYFHRELPAWPELSTQEAVVFVARPYKRLPYSSLRCLRWDSTFTVVPCRTESLFELLPRSGGQPKQEK